MAHMVARRILLGEMYQFPVLEQIGAFLVKDVNPVPHPVFLREVCKTTDRIFRSDDIVWKRLLKAQLGRQEGSALRTEAKRITGAYERWLVHTALLKSRREKAVYWPSVANQLRWYRLYQDICILRARRDYLRNTQVLGGGNVTTTSKISGITHKIISLQKKMRETVSGGHVHHYRKSMNEMLESGKVLRDSILPLVSSLVETTKRPRKSRDTIHSDGTIKKIVDLLPRLLVSNPSNLDVEAIGVIMGRHMEMTFENVSAHLRLYGLSDTARANVFCLVHSVGVIKM